MEEEVEWMEDGDTNLSEGKLRRGGPKTGCLTLDLHLSFLSSSLHRPFSGGSVWHTSLHLPCKKETKGGQEARRSVTEVMTREEKAVMAGDVNL